MLKTRQRSNEALSNPDDLERSIRVTGPSVWMVLIACILVLVGFFIWGMMGSVTTNVTALGTVVNGKAVCFLPAEEVGMVQEGNAVDFGSVPMEVVEIGRVPSSVEEARSELGSDYLADTLLPGDWGYRIAFKGDTSKFEQGVLETVNITVESVSPMSLIMRDRGLGHVS